MSITSQAVIVVTVLDGKTMRIHSYGSPDCKDSTAEQFADSIVKIAHSIWEHVAEKAAKEEPKENAPDAPAEEGGATG